MSEVAPQHCIRVTLLIRSDQASNSAHAVTCTGDDLEVTFLLLDEFILIFTDSEYGLGGF